MMLFFWGALAFGLSPAAQAGMLARAERFTPQAVAFASALNISAFNLGRCCRGAPCAVTVDLAADF
ncbi:MAG: hypothetical protein V4749_03215 [Pseudomonadota bacterium]